MRAKARTDVEDALLVVALLDAAEHLEHRGETAPRDLCPVPRTGGHVEADVVVPLADPPLHLREQARLADPLVARHRDDLRALARRLREDPAMIEDLARRELGLIRPGEKLFIIREIAPADLQSPK